MSEEQESTVLNCIHKQQLFVGKIGGVFHYSHEDGTSCAPYNSFVTPVEQIIYTIGVSETKETPALKASFALSPELRMRYYKTISQQKDKKTLLQWLTRVYNLMVDTHNEDTIAGELQYCFGRIVWQNFAFLNPDRQYQLTAVAVTHTDYPYLPRTSESMPMLNIKNAQVDNAFLDIEEALEKRRNQWASSASHSTHNY